MIGVGGLCSVYDPPVSYWCSEHPSGGGAFAFRTPSGVIYKSPNGPYEHGSLAAFMDLYGSISIFLYGYGSIPINTIFSGMNIHLPAILMFTRGTRFWHTAISIFLYFSIYTYVTYVNLVKLDRRPHWTGMFVRGMIRKKIQQISGQWIVFFFFNPDKFKRIIYTGYDRETGKLMAFDGYLLAIS